MDITNNPKKYVLFWYFSAISQANFLHADLVKNENVTFIDNAIPQSGGRNCGPLRHFIYYRSSQVSFETALIIF